jgi:molybdopterin/thiamine biosynthesis adenylyltransferase
MQQINNIAIAGAGGIGSNLLAILFDYGFNRKQFDYMQTNVDIYDDDTVDIKNLLHQNFKIDDVGKHKVEVLEDKYVVNGIKRRMTAEDFEKYDVIFSCVDSMEFRKSLYEYSWTADKGKLFWIDGRCTSRQAALFNSDLPKETLLPYIDDSKEEGGCLLAYEKEQNISHALPVIVAGMMVQTFLNKLRGQTTFKNIFMI